MNQPFDHSGHLTDDALHCLFFEETDELTRLELAEHLSFCDCCIERYTTLLCDASLLDPPEPLARYVMGEAAKQGVVLYFQRFASAAMAACLALTFWFAGMFEPHIQGEHYAMFYTLSEQATSKTQKLGEGVADGFLSLFYQLYNLDLKGVFQNEK